RAKESASPDEPVLRRGDLTSQQGGEGETLPSEVGVYFVKEEGDDPEFMEPEVVTWKTGGFLKSMATMGLTKGHVNGVVKPKSSPYLFKGTETLYIYCREGVTGSEYQLLRFWEKKNRREFRMLTGGIVHASGGADENTVEFDPERIDPRLYKYRLPDLRPGEYGLLPPGVSNSASAASAGKIYTFKVGS
ncbi:MAG TPA: hypothetical protein VLV83_14095, partial [Acidobacteriota bacterium]|nr:hypothetical protein [Acidobacteriota bacterium]